MQKHLLLAPRKDIIFEVGSCALSAASRRTLVRTASSLGVVAVWVAFLALRSCQQDEDVETWTSRLGFRDESLNCYFCLPVSAELASRLRAAAKMTSRAPVPKPLLPWQKRLAKLMSPVLALLLSMCFVCMYIILGTLSACPRRVCECVR